MKIIVKPLLKSFPVLLFLLFSSIQVVAQDYQDDTSYIEKLNSMTTYVEQRYPPGVPPSNSEVEPSSVIKDSSTFNSDPICYNEGERKEQSSNPKKMWLHNQLIRGLSEFTSRDKNDSFVSAYYYYYFKKMNAQENHRFNLPNTNLPEPKTVLKRITNLCIANSLVRENDTQGYYCETEDSTANQMSKLGRPGPMGSCITREIVDYVSWAVNQAIDCMNGTFGPINPLVIMEKINNESGFNYHQFYNGGTGISQLTSISVIQMNSRTGGKYILDKVMNSPLPSCQPFKKLLAKRPENVNPKNNICNFINYAEGLGRTLIYGLGYFVHTRNDLLVQFNKKLIKYNQQNNIAFKDIAALSAYGKEGLGVQNQLIKILDATKGNQERFFQSAQKSITYLKQTQKTLGYQIENLDALKSCLE